MDPLEKEIFFLILYTSMFRFHLNFRGVYVFFSFTQLILTGGPPWHLKPLPRHLQGFKACLDDLAFTKGNPQGDFWESKGNSQKRPADFLRVALGVGSPLDSQKGDVCVCVCFQLGKGHNKTVIKIGWFF